MSLTLEAEIKSYNNFIKQQETTFLKLSQFFKAMTINGLKFVELSKKALDDYFIELKKENPTATHIICLTNFFNGLKKYFDKMKDIYQDIDVQCANKIIEFSNNFKNKVNEPINNLLKINNKLKEEKTGLEKTKNDYFNANKNVAEVETRIIQLKESKNKKEEEFRKNNDILEKNIEILDNMKSLYLVEINKYNKSAVNYEKIYDSEVRKIYFEQEKKIKFLYEILNYFKKDIKDLTESNKEVYISIEKLNKSMNISRDVNLFKDECNFRNEEKKRFILEEFLDYEVFKNNTEENRTPSFHKKDKKINVKKLWGNSKKEIETKQKIEDLIVKILNDEDKISDGDTSFLMGFVDKEKENHLKFIELLMDIYKPKSFLKINSLYNFNLLSSLIQLIIDRNSNSIESLSEYYFFLIHLSENTLYNEKETKISLKNYLCHKIYKLPIFAKKSFWMYLIDTKIKNFTEEKTKAEIEKKEKVKGNKGNMSERGNTNYYNRFKGMFSFNSNENKKLENEIVFGQKFKDNLPLYCVEVIEEYIQHFSNYNLEKHKCVEIVSEMYKKYNFDNIYYDYFMAEIKSNTCSSKSQIEIFQNLSMDIKSEKYKFNIINKENFSDNKILNALAFSISYLDIKEYKKMMTLNKDYYKVLKKVIYKQILLKYPNMNIGKKITIWKIILDFSDFKKEYNYKETKDSIIKKSEEHKGRGRDIIDLDVVRTSFDKNKDANQKKISYILKSIVEQVPTLHYNQGMNYIAAFLLNITEDEEESFYLFLGLLTSTKYGELFKDDLAQLKKFFYIFERLISIYIPELYNFFLDNNIKASYFISSWFITLFTNAFPHIKEKNNPQILLKIWDLFFYNGWKSIIITSISLLKIIESKIIIFPPEELLHFLIGEVIKDSFFDNENYNKFMYILINFKIENKLIDNLEKEFEIKRKMPDKGKNLNFQII